MRKPTEEEIQKALKMLEEKDPKKATRENAIKTVKGLMQLAGVLVDKVDEDLKSGKLKVSDDGEVTRDSQNGKTSEDFMPKALIIFSRAS